MELHRRRIMYAVESLYVLQVQVTKDGYLPRITKLHLLCLLNACTHACSPASTMPTCPLEPAACPTRPTIPHHTLRSLSSTCAAAAA